MKRAAQKHSSDDYDDDEDDADGEEGCQKRLV